MFSSALAISAPIPLVLDLTLEFGPVLLLALLVLLDLSAVAVLHAALTAHPMQFSGPDDKPAAIPFPSRRPPTSHAA
jgi:hypothetical protein